MHTAEDLELFVDRTSIQWGEEWSTLIDGAIAGTTFFIPIITPSYFRSDPCRQELLKFSREARRSGLDRLLMPILWLTVSELQQDGEDSADEAIRAVGAHQWRDLRGARLEDRGSSAYRKEVDALAAEIASRAQEVAANVEDISQAPTEQPQSHLATAPIALEESENDEEGILDRVVRGDDALERLGPVMASITEDIRQAGTLAEQAGIDIQAAQTRGQGTRAALVITERLAKQLDGPATKLERDGREYAEHLADLDVGMQTRLTLLDESDDPLSVEEAEFLEAVQGLSDSADEALDQLQDLVTTVSGTAKVSRSLKAPSAKMRAGLQGVLDGRAITADWRRQAQAIREKRQPDSES